MISPMNKGQNPWYPAWIHEKPWIWGYLEGFAYEFILSIHVWIHGEWLFHDSWKKHEFKGTKKGHSLCMNSYTWIDIWIHILIHDSMSSYMNYMNRIWKQIYEFIYEFAYELAHEFIREYSKREFIYEFLHEHTEYGDKGAPNMAIRVFQIWTRTQTSALAPLQCRVTMSQ